ncbi:N-hydroxyarylamine O-acetyltransferase [Stackebrandtia albiflava]|uniref:N-hydroxyarylamine O-acetyltransferase n=1 Tax=Stackebrandtia albiflava TaxID=406432 RepID=A0A562VAB3_9ACTN|nr:arylamine N-acetyltransferase [Stackebrandtia albiflava]TWJ14788.1 N-hydroxyarylamine O-acetyltransferase [Stackebrandtia albiflava]
MTDVNHPPRGVAALHPGLAGGAADPVRYLARTGHPEPARADTATLRSLQAAHMSAIPFENLAIPLGAGVDVDPAAITAKLVDRRRGGYCYEHNLLFGGVLERLGYKVSLLGARVRMGSEKVRPVSHAALLVEVDGEPLLTDVGFGADGLRAPMPLRDGEVVEQDGWRYRLDHVDGEWLLSSWRPEGWLTLYGFSHRPQYPVDYEVYNHYTATHPSSVFVGRLVAQRSTPSTRYSLVNTTFATVNPRFERSEEQVAPDRIPGLLREVFGIELDDEESAVLVGVAERLAAARPEVVDQA